MFIPNLGVKHPPIWRTRHIFCSDGLVKNPATNDLFWPFRSAWPGNKSPQKLAMCSKPWSWYVDISSRWLAVLDRFLQPISCQDVLAENRLQELIPWTAKRVHGPWLPEADAFLEREATAVTARWHDVQWCWSPIAQKRWGSWWWRPRPNFKIESCAIVMCSSSWPFYGVEWPAWMDQTNNRNLPNEEDEKGSSLVIFRSWKICLTFNMNEVKVLNVMPAIIIGRRYLQYFEFRGRSGGMV